ncbi:hypothetical protein [Paenibacillus sp. NPDC057934]|uniref:hypothetical protein n=1 Tax=Paenibacillus sp. NPDC057934 TaxID=3346282 RepID=UPI0036D7EEF0
MGDDFSHALSELDQAIENIDNLSLEEVKLFLEDLQKRAEYIELIIKAKKMKASFKESIEDPSNLTPASTQPEITGNIVYGTTIITDNDRRFGILRFSKLSEISQKLSPNSKILIKYAGKVYQGSIPKSVIGRINGLSSMYSEHSEFTTSYKLSVEYDFVRKIMIIANS